MHPWKRTSPIASKKYVYHLDSLWPWIWIMYNLIILEIRHTCVYVISIILQSQNIAYYISLIHLQIMDVPTNRTLLNATGGYESLTVSFLSTSNVIQVISNNVRNMRLYYHSNINTLPTGCGGDLTSLENQFANPPYDNRNYSECTWRISVPAGNPLQFYFRSK